MAGTGTTYIITTEDFQQRADLSNNIRTDKIQAHIGPTQEIFTRKILCENLYNELISAIANGTLTPELTSLLPYVKDYLVYKTYREYLVTANVTLTPMGVRVQTDTTSEPATDKQMAEIMKQSQGIANYYQDRLVNFLTLNEDDYPSWKDSICNCNANIRTQKNNSFSVIANPSRKVYIDWT